MARPDAWHGAYCRAGIYIPRDDSTAEIAQAYRGMGIRIEDAVLIQNQGRQVLTEGLIKEPDDIEAWMALVLEKGIQRGWWREYWFFAALLRGGRRRWPCRSRRCAKLGRPGLFGDVSRSAPSSARSIGFWHGYSKCCLIAGALRNC